MKHIGDKSDEYAKLRKQIDEQLPLNHPERSLLATQEARWIPQQDGETDGETLNKQQLPPYDIHSCPDEPPHEYPFEWNTLELLEHWPPDNVHPPGNLEAYQGLCIFDYFRDYVKILKYRREELPFIVRGDPQVAQAVERWNYGGYMSRLLTDRVRHRAEYSTSNHFLYWLPPGRNTKPPTGRTLRPPPESVAPPGWKEPTKHLRMTYTEWLAHANATSTPDKTKDQEGYYYFRLIGCGETGPRGECDSDVGTSEWLFDELEFFQPRKDSLYLVNPKEQNGIHCRFGSAGLVAENHFDGSRNSIVMLSGARRYILSHPKQCENLALFPRGHPSARHSQIEWSADSYHELQQAHEEEGDSYHPEFQHAKSNQVVLQPGDVLQLPTHWFHFIVSLSEITMQCNTRSGKANTYRSHIDKCGF